MWLILLVVVIVVLAAAAFQLPREVRLYRRSRERRGGMLELDTWEARNALNGGGPSDSRNPGQRVHYHGAGDRCQCGETSNVYSLPGYAHHPFAARGDDAA